MNKNKFIDILDMLNEFFILAIDFVIPIWFSYFFPTYNIFELNKIVVFKLLVAPLVFFTIFKALFYRAVPVEQAEGVSNFSFFAKYLWPFLIWIVFLFLSLFYSADPVNSFFGIYQRQSGLESVLFLFLFFSCLLFHLQGKSRSKINHLLYTLAWSSGIVGIYGILQIFGIDFLTWSENPETTKRAISTLGQPNFLGSFLLLTIPIITYLIAKNKNWLFKIFYFLLLLTQLICLFFTASRGAWVGLLFATLLFLFFIIKRKRAALNHSALEMFLVILIVIIPISLLFTNTNFRNRVSTAFDTQGGSVAMRLKYWQTAWQGFKEKPFLGYGLESQKEVLIKAYDADYGVYEKINSYADRAHNIIFDTLITGGIIGLLLFSFLLFKIFQWLTHNIRYGQEEHLSLALMLAFIAYFISLLFSFSTVVTDVYFWLLAALTVFLNYAARPTLEKDLLLEKTVNQEIEGVGIDKEGIKEGVVENIKENNIDYDFKQFTWVAIPNAWLLKIILIVAIGLASTWSLRRDINSLIADHYFNRMNAALNQGDFYTAYLLRDYIREQNVYDYYYDYYLANFLNYNWLQLKTVVNIKGGQWVLEDMLNNIYFNSYDNLSLRGRIYSSLFKFNEAKFYLEKAIAINPLIPRPQQELGRMYYRQGSYDQAIISFNKALELSPDINNPKLNSGHLADVKYFKYIIYRDLALTYIGKQDYNKARESYLQAYDNNPADINVFKSIADIYYQEGKLDEAVFYNEKGWKLNPQNYVWPLAIALLYEEKNDGLQALYYARESFKLNTSDPEANRIIKKYAE